MFEGLDRDGFCQSKEHEFFETERDNMKTTNDYQLDSLRARFAARGYNTMNHRRSHHVIGWVAVGMALLFSIGCLVAAFTLY